MHTILYINNGYIFFFIFYEFDSLKLHYLVGVKVDRNIILIIIIIIIISISIFLLLLLSSLLKTVGNARPEKSDVRRPQPYNTNS